MQLRNIIAAALCVLGTHLAIPVAQSQEDAAIHEIIPVTEDLYRFRSNAHYGVFLVTDEGIIVADPINADTARWLRTELAHRFELPVRYLIYSHDHADHASGGEEFGSETEIIAHVNTAKAMVNNAPVAALPDTVFDEEARIELGGEVVELIYLGPSHSDSLIAVNFPRQRALFAVDIISVRRLPYRDFGDSYYPGLIEALNKISALDFDILIPGHGEMGTKADAEAYRAYVVRLAAETRQAIRDGLSVDQAKRQILMSGYSDWAQYDEWHELNVEGMYRLITEALAARDGE